MRRRDGEQSLAGAGSLIRVKPAQRTEAPVRLDGAECGIVRVKRRIGRSAKVARNGAAEEGRPYAVVHALGLVLVKRKKNERALIVKAPVGEEWLEPELEP